MANRFNTKTEYQTVSTILTRLKNTLEEQIILDPPYQRNIVWKENTKSYFINSVMRGIVPNNVLFNCDANGNYICMDGKQRIKSLEEFKNNMIPVVFEDNDKITYAFYSNMPVKYADNKDYRIFTQEERNAFNQMTLPVATYNNLSYEEQVEIFHRIQHGVSLSQGELISAYFTNDAVTKLLEEFCNKKIPLLQKYLTGINRKEHINPIVTIMYMANKSGKIQIPPTKQKYAFIKLLDKPDKMKKELDRIDSLLDICFGPNLLGHPTFTSKMQQNYIFVFVHLINTLFSGKLDKISAVTFAQLRSALRKTYKEIQEGYNKKITVTKKNIDTVEALYNSMNKYYLDLSKHNLEVSDNEDEDIDDIKIDADDDSEDQIEDKISSEEEKKPVKKVAKTRARKVTAPKRTTRKW